MTVIAGIEAGVEAVALLIEPVTLAVAEVFTFAEALTAVVTLAFGALVKTSCPFL